MNVSGHTAQSGAPLAELLATGVFDHDDVTSPAEAYRLAQQRQMQEYVFGLSHPLTPASDPSAQHKRGSVVALASRGLVSSTLSNGTGICCI